MLVLNFLCLYHILLYHASLPQVIQLFQFLSFHEKRLNDCEGYVSFQDIEHQLHYSFIHIFIIVFDEILID